MLSHALCAFIAPAVVAAAAYNPRSLPAPTLVIPEIDSWSPAPTQAPNARHIDFLRRATSSFETVCGYTSGIFTSSVTCPPGKSSVCATNTYYGVHGCCDPANMEACVIPTTCIASSQVATLCTGSACAPDSLTLKCTGTEAPECARWDFIYSVGRTTTYSEWGCAAKPGTVTVEKTPRASGAVTTSSTKSSSSSSSTTTTGTDEASPTSLPLTQTSSKPNSTGAIVGGVIGGLVVVGAVITLIIWLLLRHRRLKRESSSNVTANDTMPGQQNYGSNTSAVAEYNPHGFVPVDAWHDDQKGWIGTHASPTSTKSPGTGVYGEGWNENSGCGELGLGNQVNWQTVEAGGRPVHEAPG